MTTMEAIVFFTKILEWQWHYNLVLDSQYLAASSCFPLYIFFQCLFVMSILSPFSDPEVPFDGIPLYMAHPVTAPPPPLSLVSKESDPSEMSSSSSSTLGSRGSGHPLGGPKVLGIWRMAFSPLSWIRGYEELFGRLFRYCRVYLVFLV